MTTRRALSFIVPIALLVLLLDQGSKAWIRANIPLYGALYPIPALAPIFRLTHLTNTGAAFGLLRDSGLLYLLIAGVIAIAVLLYARHLPWERFPVQVAMGLQLGGAMGNLLDRARLGHVTDFLDFYITTGGRTYHYPPFNLADSAIVVGVIILALTLGREERADVAVTPTRARPSPSDEPSGAPE